MPKLYLVRHAEPSVTGVLLGQADPPLGEQGRLDAVKILAGVDLALIYSSPLRRAVETARLFAGTTPVEILADLKEISHGAWNGLDWAEIEAGDPELARRKREDWFGVTAPGGESWFDFATRVAGAFECIRAGPKPCAVVAHAGVNAVIHELLTGTQPVGFLQHFSQVIEYEI